MQGLRAMNEYALYFGLIAGLVQALGYILYYYLVIRKEGKNAEPLSWFMFAYGTAMLTAMEFDSMWKAATADGSWLALISILLVPVICSLGGILVAVSIWQHHYRLTKLWWPEKWKVDWSDTDGKAFATDLGLTVLYTILWLFTLSGTTTEVSHLWWVIGFLVISNLSTFPNFVPILREVAKSPEKEDWRPWAVWSLAYTLLLIPTWMYGTENVVWPTGLPWDWDVSFFLLLALMSYPASNAIMHSFMSFFAAKRPHNTFKPAE